MDAVEYSLCYRGGFNYRLNATWLWCSGREELGRKLCALCESYSTNVRVF